MIKSIRYMIVMAILFCSSCKTIGTLYPLSDQESDFIYRKDLTGTWSGSDSGLMTLKIDTVENNAGKLYSVELISQDQPESRSDTNYFQFRLLQLKGLYFIDCWYDLEKELSSYKKDMLDWAFTYHLIYQLTFSGHDMMDMWFPDSDEMAGLIQKKKIELDYTEIREDHFLVLNKPTDLQTALIRTVNDFHIYNQKTHLERLR